MWIVGLVLLGVAAFCAFQARSQARRVAQMEATESKTVAELDSLAETINDELGAGQFYFPAEVNGTVVCDLPLKTELAGLDAVHYSMSVVRHYEHRVETTNAEGRRESRMVQSSEGVASNSRSVPFWVEDQTGSIRVNPEGAEWVTEKVLSRYEQGSRGSSFGGFRLSSSSWGSGNGRTLGYRYEEEAVPVGRRVYILGVAADSPEGIQMRKPDKDGRLIISVKSEDVLKEQKQSSVAILWIVAGVSAIIGVYCLFAGLTSG